jgi:glycerol kinase
MEPHNLILGIDQGSSSSKAILLDSEGAVHAEFYAAVPERIEDGQKVEQDPEGLLDSVIDLFRKAKAWSATNGARIIGAGMAVQRSGVLAWNSTDGRIRHRMMTWADTSTQPTIDNLGPGVGRVSAQTGIPTIAHFAAGKIHSLQRQFLDPAILVSTLDTFLIHRLSGRKVFVTEDTMAARTMLYALKERSWSKALCREFGVDASRLPMISPSLSVHTEYDGIPIVAMLGDQQAALIGRGGPEKRPLLNLGTIASLAKNTGSEIVQKPGLMTSVLLSRPMPNASGRNFTFLTELTSPVTGTVLLEPLRRGWCSSSEELTAMCQKSHSEHPEGRATGYFVNHRAASPTSTDTLPNVMVCREGASNEDRARAIVENVGNIIIRMIEEFSDKGLLPGSSASDIDVAGGGSELDYLLQYIADVSGHTLHRRGAKEAGARGAALCAWMQIHGKESAAHLNNDPDECTYRCSDPSRRTRYLKWQRLELDTRNGKLPPQAEVER